jgi:ABC-2 type transport system permease protein
VNEVLRLELRRSRSLLVWLTVVLVGYGAFLAALYPTLRANAAAIEEYIRIYPKEFMEAFGMTGSLADPGVFFTSYIASWIWPIVVAIACVLLGTRAVAADLDRGFLELPLSTSMSRTRYLALTIAHQVIVLAVLSVACVIGVLVVGGLVGAGFDVGRFLLVTPAAFAFGAAVMGASTLLAVITLSRGRAGGIAVGGLILMYLLEVAGRIEPGLDDLRTISLFRYFNTMPVISQGVVDLVALAVLGLVAASCWVLALVLFTRRDLVA